MKKPSLFDEANREWDAGNLKSALKLFHKAAEQGESNAMNSIGYMIDHGIGTRKNAKKAFLWYKKAARKGDIAAISNVAIYYRDKGNFARAKFWFLKNINKFDDGDDMLELAKLYLKRNGSRNLSTAIKYLRRATKSRYISEAGREEAEALLNQQMK